ncbi:DUF1538 family protein [Bacillus sp. m3-13]|uniref:DUF1538 family protein n=1 Tax=Bacillus sp. m3-13 TaxID=406124 RepID=UPI002E1069C9
MILSVALGVGIFVALAMVRTIYKIKLPYLIMPAYLLCFSSRIFYSRDIRSDFI